MSDDQAAAPHDVWDDIAAWWVDAVERDPASSVDFVELVRDLIAHDGAVLTLDVGCGEGQLMRALGAPIVGVDVSAQLLRRAARSGPVVRARLPDLAWARSGAFERCVCVGVVELIDDHRALLAELHRVTRDSGSLVVVMNHPVTTAPAAEPLVDPTGDLLWRWGSYLRPGRVRQPLGDHEVTLYHRPVGELLTAASEVGWRLERLIETGPSPATRERDPDFRGLEDVPSLLGVRWSR